MLSHQEIEWQVKMDKKERLIQDYKKASIGKEELLVKWPDDPLECTCGWRHVDIQYADMNKGTLDILCPSCNSVLVDGVQ